MTWSPYFPSWTLNAYLQIKANTAWNQALLPALSSAAASAFAAAAAASAVSGSSAVSGMIAQVQQYGSGLGDLLAHASGMFSQMPLLLGVYCGWSTLQYGLYGYTSGSQGWTSGQVAANVSGWFGTVLGSGQAVVTSGSVYVAMVSAAVVSGVSGLLAVSGVVTPALASLYGQSEGLVTNENAAYSGGLSGLTLYGGGAGLHGDYQNPGGHVVIAAVGSSGLLVDV